MRNSKKLERLKGLLECSVCLEQFDNPKMLACTHEFCKLCIEHIAQFEEDGSLRIACPMRCEQKTNLNKSQTVDNLTASYNFKNVLEAFMEEDEENPPEEKNNVCSHTSKCRNKPITVYCCNQVMCEACYNMHKNNSGRNNSSHNKKKKHDSNNTSNSSHDNDSCNNDKGNNNNNDSNSNNNQEDMDVHQKVNVGFNKRENKLMVVCNDHNTFCTSVCSDKKLLCTYCEHRDSNHKDHIKTPIENDISLLKDLLRIELNGRERLLKFRMMTEKYIEESREVLQETLRQKKDECLRLYSELLETEEKHLMDCFDQHCYSHTFQTDYDDNISPEYCKEMLLKHDVELFLEKEHIFKEISKYPRCQYGISSSTVQWEESSEYLSTSPLGEIHNWGSHEVETIKESPHSTLKFQLKKHIKQEESECTNNDGTAVQDVGITRIGKIDSKEDVWVEDDYINLDVALAMKSQGNEYFKNGWYQNAKDSYSKAIEYCPCDSPERAIFYQNRAAAEEELGHDLSDAINDCDEALVINPKYIKALQRKARLHLKEGDDHEIDLEEALYDAIAAKYLDDPANRWRKHDYNELLCKIGEKKALKYVESNHGFELPPTSYAITISLSDNNCDLFSISIVSKSKEDEMFCRIMEDLKKQYYEDITDACTKVIDMNGKHKYRSMLLRGIIRFCRHDAVNAFSDFDEVLTHAIDDTMETKQLKVDAMVRRACLKACTGDHAGFLSDMNVAILLDHNNASIYHCRAKFGTEVRGKDEIIADYRTAIVLDDTFVAPRLALCEHLSRIPKSECAETSTTEKVGEILTDAFRLFPKNSEVCCAYAQYLFKIGKKEEGYLKAEKAISLAPKGIKNMQRARGYAMKAHMTMCTELGIIGSAKLCAKALELDEECSNALGLLGEIEFMTCEYEGAVKLFQRTIECSPRRVQELIYTFCQLAECETRIEVLKDYGGETWLKRDMTLPPEVWRTKT